MSVKIEGPTRDSAKGVDVYAVTSPFLSGVNRVEVLVPDCMVEGHKYRTLYVLPVEDSTGREYGDGLAEVRKADAQNRYGLICVTMTFDSIPWYGSHATNPAIRHEDYIRQVVVPLIESRHPTTGNSRDRLLLGFSKSGWGAISLLLRDPDFFGAACSWDAPLMMTEKEAKYASAGHFGTPEKMADYVPMTLAKRKSAVFASGDPRITILGDDHYATETVAFHEHLLKAGHPSPLR